MKGYFAEKNGRRKDAFTIRIHTSHKSTTISDKRRKWRKEEENEMLLSPRPFTPHLIVYDINRRRIPHSVMVSAILKENAYVNHFLLFATNMIILPLPNTTKKVMEFSLTFIIKMYMYVHRPCVKIKRKNILLEKNWHCVLVSSCHKTKVFFVWNSHKNIFSFFRFSFPSFYLTCHCDSYSCWWCDNIFGGKLKLSSTDCVWLNKRVG